MERHGGFKGAKESGLALWLLSHAMDAAASDNMHNCEEFMALLALALEQSVLDDWHLAYPGPSGGASLGNVSGEAGVCHRAWSTLCQFGSSFTCSHDLEFHEGGRGALFEKARGEESEKGSEPASSSCSNEGGGQSESQTQAKVSSEAKSGSRGDFELEDVRFLHAEGQDEEQAPEFEHSPKVPLDGGRREPFVFRPSEKEELAEIKVSFPMWCSRLISFIIRSRCSFSPFILRMMVVSRSEPGCLRPAPTFFPHTDSFLGSIQWEAWRGC